MAREPFLWPVALALVHAALWYWANLREGVWQQVPATDASADLRVAWIFWKALAQGNIVEFARAWMHANPVHTPLVPAMSALIMLAFGASRIAAEAVLPLSTVVWLIATYAVVARLYDRLTARWATALVSAFPVFLIYSRTYLFEHPTAAVFACSCWALLQAEGFTNRWQAAIFGLLAGLTVLARGGAFVYLIGPVLVAVAVHWRSPDRGKRLANLALAGLVAGALAATWYLPNLEEFTRYVYRATYGDDAEYRTGGTGALSFSNAWYYVTSLVIQGPGVPMLCVAAAAWAVTFFSGARTVARATRALAAVFLIDFAVLATAAQHEGARYFQPLMPVIAVALVRAILSLRVPQIRLLAGSTVAALALHHVVTLQVAFRNIAPDSTRPSIGNVTMWDHQTYLSGLREYYGLRDPPDDFRIPETIDLLTRLGFRADARIGTLQTTHPFFQPNGLQLEATRRELAWTFVWSPPIDTNGASVSRAIPSAVDVLLVRTGGPTGIDLSSIAPALPTGLRAADALTLGDGSTVTVFTTIR